METKWIALDGWQTEMDGGLEKEQLEGQVSKLKEHPGIVQAAKILQKGGLVAFPTETVYGLGANGLDSEAAGRIYAAKGRPSDNPLILHIASMEELPGIVREIPETAKKLAKRFWPGPLTMIFPKADCVPDGTTGGLATVAVRMPKHPIALALIACAGLPIAAPSANRSGRPSTTTAWHVKEDMDGQIDCIIDGGEVGVGLESTIVDVTGEKPMMLRPGYITKEMLEEAVGEVFLDPVITATQPDPTIKPKAPGMKYRHYAPKAELVVVDGRIEAVVDEINRLAKEKEEAGSKVGIIGTQETVGRYKAGNIKCIGTRTDESTIASHLYGILREFDSDGAEFIYSEAFAAEGIGSAVMNRLLKAAGHRVMHV